MNYRRWGMTFLLLASYLAGAGCKSGGTTGEADPLLVKNKPVEGSSADSPSYVLARNYPEPPNRPVGPWQVALETKEPLLPEEQPGHWSTRKSSVHSDLRLTSHSRYGYGTNHQWLQGELERHSRDQILLRYTPMDHPDAWGGRVALESHPHLEAFLDGDQIYLEGEIVREEGRILFGQWSPYPRYRIERALLVKRAD